MDSSRDSVLIFKMIRGYRALIYVLLVLAIALCAGGPTLWMILYLSGEFSGYQLKIVQEAITLSIFMVFAWWVLKEKLTWSYAVSFALIMADVYFVTAFRPA